jgi:hypothetical protein
VGADDPRALAALAASVELVLLVSALTAEAIRTSYRTLSAGQTGFQFRDPTGLVVLILIAASAVLRRPALRRRVAAA